MGTPVCTPQKVLADELDCLGYDPADYQPSVVMVFSNGQEQTFDDMPTGSCCFSFCHPGNGSCGYDAT